MLDYFLRDPGRIPAFEPVLDALSREDNAMPAVWLGAVIRQVKPPDKSSK